MSENANSFPGDLLSSLAANPELLKNAMQMASALASSGMLNGLLGKSDASAQAKSQASATPAFAASPEGGSPDGGSGSPGDFAGLLAGLMGAGASGAPDRAKAPPSDLNGERTASVGASVGDSGANRKKSAPPCHNDRVQLLKSVRPFLPEEKRDKIDFLVQLLGLLYSAEQMGIRKLF